MIPIEDDFVEAFETACVPPHCRACVALCSGCCRCKYCFVQMHSGKRVRRYERFGSLGERVLAFALVVTPAKPKDSCVRVPRRSHVILRKAARAAALFVPGSRRTCWRYPNSPLQVQCRGPLLLHHQRPHLHGPHIADRPPARSGARWMRLGQFERYDELVDVFDRGGAEVPRGVNPRDDGERDVIDAI